MATYYLRDTNRDLCAGCESCISACPVNALTMEEYPAVDEDWCIGCGVCVTQCVNSAARMKRRTDKVPPRDFDELYQRILQEKGLK